ncbi:hypothetical protein JG688_00004741 [Phytophthora aleatoria]|uniref:Uncharacterized protein n=1 Tax=Phytophthora aleatoria TaxID=2496075 RepID=A0A8J5MH50_9STRA|nr:hypothetical protein JG688_00004741 [Phytophthora aleatoria]
MAERVPRACTRLSIGPVWLPPYVCIAEGRFSPRWNGIGRRDGRSSDFSTERWMEDWCSHYGQCGRAHRILALRFPKIIILLCFAHCINNIVKSVLKSEFSETSLEMLASKYQASRDFPSALKVFNGGSFWSGLVEAERVIAPLSEASYRLQRDENTMSDVRGESSRTGLIKCVEDRWEQYEQPLFMLTFVLNPLTAEEARKLIDRTDEERRTAEADRYLACGDTSENEAQLRVETSKIPARIASSTQLGNICCILFSTFDR